MRLLIRDIGQLVTCSGRRGPRAGQAAGELAILEKGAVLVDDGLITWIGHECDLSADLQVDEELAVDGRLVTPGFVDPHTHALFAGTREREFARRVAGATYEEIMAEGGGISASARMLREARDEQIIAETTARLDRMLTFGVTTCEIKSGYGLATEEEVRSIRLIDELREHVAQDIVPTYLGAHAVPPEHKTAQEDFVEYIVNEMTPAVGRLGIARYCDVFCEEGVFTVDESRRILLGARAVGMRLKIHADELASSGGTRLGAELGVDTADHLLRSSREDLEALRDAGGIGVILPGTCLGLGKTSYASGRLMTELGLPVALATDLNPGNCYCENLPLMITLGCLYAGLTVEQAVIGVTVNAAYGVGMGDNIGSIELGKQGDLVAWDVQNYRELAYHFGTPLAALVVKKGSVVFHRQGGLR
jgi:imidazolonepropionase